MLTNESPGQTLRVEVRPVGEIPQQPCRGPKRRLLDSPELSEDAPLLVEAVTRLHTFPHFLAPLMRLHAVDFPGTALRAVIRIDTRDLVYDRDVAGKVSAQGIQKLPNGAISDQLGIVD